LESPELLDYYRRRAAEYEAIYAKPERQADLAVLRRAIPAMLRGARVLEIACGTGYWTQLAADVAAQVVATDLADEPMGIAQAKSYARQPVFALQTPMRSANPWAASTLRSRYSGGRTSLASGSANSWPRCMDASSPARAWC